MSNKITSDELLLMKKLKVYAEIPINDEIRDLQRSTHVLDQEIIKKAIELSQERYCGVSAVYRKAMELSYEIRILEIE